MAYLDYTRFFEMAPDVLCMIDAEGRLLRLNAAFQRLLGWAAADLAGRLFLDLVHSDDVPATRREMNALAAGPSALGFANRYRTADGLYRTLEWNATRDPITGLVYVVGRDLVGVAASQAVVRADLEREREIAQALRISTKH